MLNQTTCTYTFPLLRNTISILSLNVTPAPHVHLYAAGSCGTSDTPGNAISTSRRWHSARRRAYVSA